MYIVYLYVACVADAVDTVIFPRPKKIRVVEITIYTHLHDSRAAARHPQMLIINNHWIKYYARPNHSFYINATRFYNFLFNYAFVETFKQ